MIFIYLLLFEINRITCSAITSTSILKQFSAASRTNVKVRHEYQIQTKSIQLPKCMRQLQYSHSTLPIARSASPLWRCFLLVIISSLPLLACARFNFLLLVLHQVNFNHPRQVLIIVLLSLNCSIDKQCLHAILQTQLHCATVSCST